MIKLDHNAVRCKMVERGYKQEPLAEKLDISSRHVRNLCNKDIDVAVSLCYRMSKAFETSMESLLIISEDSVEEDEKSE